MVKKDTEKLGEYRLVENFQGFLSHCGLLCKFILITEQLVFQGLIFKSFFLSESTMVTL